jgi:hypothetical protein
MITPNALIVGSWCTASVRRVNNSRMNTTTANDTKIPPMPMKAAAKDERIYSSGWERKKIDRRLLKKRDRGKNSRGYKGLHVHSLRLTPYLRFYLGVSDWLFAAIQIAQTARCELHSSSVSRLKKAQRARE